VKRLILSTILLIAITGLAAILLDIPASLPEGTEVPTEVREILSEDRIEQAVIYSNFRYGWYFFRNLFDFAILSAVLMLGFSPRIRDRADRWSVRLCGLSNAPLLCGFGAALAALLVLFLAATEDQPITSGSLGLALAWGLVGLWAGRSPRFTRSAAYILLFSLLLTAFDFPLAYYRGYVVEHYFDLSVESFGEWTADYLKSNLIDYLLAVVLVPMAYWGIRRYPRDWWIWIASGSVPITIVLIVIAPVYLDPLFNTYEPLRDEVLRERILVMAEDAGISGGRVLQVDKSAETQKISAYVTGLFGTKRIVLWDTILEAMTPDEIAFVMGHEMGHYILNHIWKFIGILTVILFVLLFLISRTIGLVLRRFGDRMGFHEISDIASLPLLLLMLSLLLFLIAPIFNSYSRYKEREADAFGLELTRDGSTAVSVFVKLANQNLSNPSPHPFIEFWLFDHPTLSDRIAFCRAYEPKVLEPGSTGQPDGR
jgi:Zn-dependent protease with chaperone function